MSDVNHISTERLEDYQSFGISALDSTIDDHLRECQDCRDRLLAIARFRELCKAGVIRGAERPYDAQGPRGMKK